MDTSTIVYWLTTRTEVITLQPLSDWPPNLKLSYFNQSADWPQVLKLSHFNHCLRGWSVITSVLVVSDQQTGWSVITSVLLVRQCLKCDNFSSSGQSVDNGWSVITLVLVVSTIVCWLTTRTEVITLQPLSADWPLELKLSHFNHCLLTDH
jgi:hypothetical protein